MGRMKLYVVMCVMLALVVGVGVSQADRVWVGTGTPEGIGAGSDWFELANWSVGVDPNALPTSDDNVKIDMADGFVDVFFRAADPNDDPNSVPPMVATCKGLTLNGNVTPATLTIWPGATLNSAGGGAQFLTAEANEDDIAYIDVYGTLTVGNGPFLSRRGPSTLTIYDGGVLVSAGNAEIQHGAGTINVLAGGIYENPGELKMARGANSPGQTVKAVFNLEGGQAQLLRLMNAKNATCNGEVNVNSGLLLISDDWRLANNSNPQSAVNNINGGRVIVRDQIRSDSANIEFNFTGGELAVRNWASSSAGDLVNAGGTISPATFTYNTADHTYVCDETHRSDNNYDATRGYIETSASAVVRIDIEGTTGWDGSGSEYDYFNMYGSPVELMGELDVVLRGSYVNTISSSDSFTIFQNVGSLTSGFNNLDGGNRVNIYNEQGGLEGTMLVTYPATFPGNITLSDAIITNVPPTITTADVYTYDAVKNSILVEATVDHPLGLDDVEYGWAVISQPDGSTITPDPVTLTTEYITIGVDMTGDYVLELTATKTSTGKFATAQILVAVEADPCAAAKRAPDFALLEGDINGDCSVNMEDFALLAANWMGCVSQVCP